MFTQEMYDELEARYFESKGNEGIDDFESALYDLKELAHFMAEAILEPFWKKRNNDIKENDLQIASLKSIKNKVDKAKNILAEKDGLIEVAMLCYDIQDSIDEMIESI